MDDSPETLAANTRQPTGRTRYRVQSRLFFPELLVLQIEESYVYGGRSHSVWRDARVEDVTVSPRAETNVILG